MKKVWKQIQKIVVRFFIRLYFVVVKRTKVIRDLPIPQEEPLIFCGNHSTYMDPPLMLVTAKRDVRFLAKEELYQNKFLAFLGHTFDAIAVRRDAKDISAVKNTLKALKDGNCVALFPEGTRNGLEKGEKVKDGAAFFAVRTGAKVVPVGITQNEKGFSKMTIHYGEVLDFSKYKGEDKNKEVLDEVTEEIMKNIIMLTNKEDSCIIRRRN